MPDFFGFRRKALRRELAEVRERIAHLRAEIEQISQSRSAEAQAEEDDTLRSIMRLRHTLVQDALGSSKAELAVLEAREREILTVVKEDAPEPGPTPAPAQPRPAGAAERSVILSAPPEPPPPPPPPATERPALRSTPVERAGVESPAHHDPEAQPQALEPAPSAPTGPAVAGRQVGLASRLLVVLVRTVYGVLITVIILQVAIIAFFLSGAADSSAPPSQQARPTLPPFGPVGLPALWERWQSQSGLALPTQDPLQPPEMPGASPGAAGEGTPAPESRQLMQPAPEHALRLRHLSNTASQLASAGRRQSARHPLPRSGPRGAGRLTLTHPFHFFGSPSCRTKLCAANSPNRDPAGSRQTSTSTLLNSGTG